MTGSTMRRPFFFGAGHSSHLTQEKFCGPLAPKKELSAPATGTVGKTTCRTRSPARVEQEETEPASGAGGTTQAIGANVPVGLAGHNGVVRVSVVEQDVPPLLPVGVTWTLQASLDLDDDGDKANVRRFGGRSLTEHFEEWTHGHPRRPI